VARMKDCQWPVSLQLSSARSDANTPHFLMLPSCLAESTVNAVISKRFAKRQQMQWTKRSAHLLLQTRTRTLDGTLRPLFERWYPGLANDNENGAAKAAAA